MQIGKIRRELRFHVPALVLVGCIATAVVAKNTVTGITTASASTITVKSKNAELRAQLATPNVPKGALEAAKAIEASSVSIDIPTTTQPTPNDMIFGGSRAWFEGVRGDDHYTDDTSLSAKLRNLWEYKMKVPGVKPAAQKAKDVIIDRFDGSTKTKMDVKAFVARADRLVKDTRKHLDYKRFCARMQMDDQECDLLFKMTHDLKGRDMVAYGMTELLPSLDGKKNLAILDGVLQNAGIEFLNSVPAFGDPLTSCGLYQFTSFAVRKDANSTEGASIVNDFVEPGHGIPGSVVLLSSDDQHRAAFLFTTYNVARWIKKMSAPQMKMARHLMPKHQEELVEYIAVSHHMPGRTIQYANAWLDRKGKDDFLAFLPPHLKLYGRKTQTNYEALMAFVG